MSKINTIAFILHPLNVSKFKQKIYFYKPFEGVVALMLRFFKESFIKKMYSKLPPHVFINDKNVTIKNTKFTFNIIGIMCCVFPEEVINNREICYKKIKKSLKLAVKKGASVVVLTGFTSMISEYADDVKNDEDFLNVTITSGSVVTALLSLEGIDLVIKSVGLDFKRLTFSLIGATGDIGSLVLRLIQNKYKKVILCARKIEKNIASLNISSLKSKYEITRDIRYASAKGDVIFLSTSSYIPLISGDEVKKGAIICDTSLPHNVEADINKSRGDIFVFDGGVAKIDFEGGGEKFRLFLQDNNLYGCIAEGVLLCCKNIQGKKYLKTSDITNEDITYIKKCLSECQIELSDFKFHGKSLSQK